MKKNHNNVNKNWQTKLNERMENTKKKMMNKKNKYNHHTLQAKKINS